MSEIRWYLFFLMLMMWGFAVSYCILFRQDQEYEQFSNVWHSLLVSRAPGVGRGRCVGMLRLPAEGQHLPQYLACARDCPHHHPAPPGRRPDARRPCSPTPWAAWSWTSC